MDGSWCYRGKKCAQVQQCTCVVLDVLTYIPDNAVVGAGLRQCQQQCEESDLNVDMDRGIIVFDQVTRIDFRSFNITK